jgi:hypothetical protein
MIAVKFFQTKSGYKIAIKVCPEIPNHDPVENFKSGSAGKTLIDPALWLVQVGGRGCGTKKRN